MSLGDNLDINSTILGPCRQVPHRDKERIVPLLMDLSFDHAAKAGWRNSISFGTLKVLFEENFSFLSLCALKPEKSLIGGFWEIMMLFPTMIAWF